jgi:SAM-dependent methyltransferase
MLRQASSRNAAAIQAGRATLTRASIEQLPPALDGPFDAIVAVNTLGFWTAPAERLQDLRHRLTPGGRIAVATQPRCPAATRNTSRRRPRDHHLPRTAGFTQTRTEMPPAARRP